jgi:hypothetical protein
MATDQIISIEDFIRRVKEICEKWKNFPWFRGEPDSNTPLLPKLYRQMRGQDPNYENQLLQHFRMKSQSPEFGYTPPRDHNDQWLFLARHSSLPTRLLDWTEGLLVALYFAIVEQEALDETGKIGNPIVWMLDPIELNRLVVWWKKNKKNYVKEPLAKLDSINNETYTHIKNDYDSYRKCEFSDYNVFALTWLGPKGGIGSENIEGAWLKDSVGTDFPVAVHPTNIHARMSVQKSCFTVHGKEKKPLNELLDRFGFKYLRKFVIDRGEMKKMLEDLRMLGISHATLFPDLDGLAKDLEKRFQ